MRSNGAQSKGRPLSVDLENVIETVGTVTRTQHIRELDSMFNYLYLAGYCIAHFGNLINMLKFIKFGLCI